MGWCVPASGWVEVHHDAWLDLHGTCLWARLLVPYMAQAVLMFERGEASAEDIDTAMQLGTGVPMVRSGKCWCAAVPSASCSPKAKE